MRRLTESEINTIFERREHIEQACRQCTEFFKTLSLVNPNELTIKQAKAIVAWEMVFLRFETRMTDITAKRKFSAAIFPDKVQEAMQTIADALIYGRLTLVGPHLNRALSLLQKTSGNTRSVQKYSHVYAEDEDPDDVVTASIDDQNAGEKYAAHLENKDELDKEKKELVLQNFKKAGDIVKRDLFKETADFKAQKRVRRLMQRMQEIDESVLISARSDIKSKYEIIKNNHEALDIWIDIVKSAYTLANHNVDIFLDKVSAQKERRDKIKMSLMKGFVSLAMSPFMLHLFVDPAIQMASEVASKLGDIAADFAETSEASPHDDKPLSVLQRQFISFLVLIGKDAGSKAKNIRQIDEMRQNNPVEYVELMKRFSDYKLNGVAKEMSQAFDHGTHAWGGLTPEEIIKAQRMKLMRKEQAACSEEEWQSHQKDNFESFFRTITLDLKRSYKEASQKVFDEINLQYPKKNDMLQLQKIITHFSFDEASSGPNSFRSENRKALVKALADEIEIAIVLKYAAIYDPFFGGDAAHPLRNIKATNDLAFDPFENSHFALKANRQGKAILDHLILKMPHKKSELEPLKRIKWNEYLYELWHLGITDKQLARQQVLNPLIQEYVNIDISHKLKVTLFKFAAENKIEIRDNIRPTIKQEWRSEETLREHAKNVLAPFIVDAKNYQAVTRRQCDLSERVILSHQLIESTPSTLDNETMQTITDLGRTLKV